MGIVDAAAARKNLDLLRKKIGDEALSGLLPSLATFLTGAADPDMALNNLERFVSGTDESAAFVDLCRTRPEILRVLVIIFGASRFLSTFLISLGREGLLILQEPFMRSGLAVNSELRERLGRMLRGADDERQFSSCLRKFRKQEMLRIGLRDLQGTADLQETVGGLSALAEVCLQGACDRVAGDLEKRHGRPLRTMPDGTAQVTGFAVVAMGKLGGRELNFSSDIDLMYVYSMDGETEGIISGSGVVQNRITSHQYFVKLAERLTAMIGESTEDGFVFRVDLRLRPEGRRGPLAQSVGGYEIYYESWGQTWERAALLKARPVAGDEGTGREFMERIAPFVYRKYLDFGAIAEIREMKQKINRDVRQKGKEFRDVKLGYGGIREVEFLVQALQLIYAGRDRALRERNTLKALHMLSQKGLITYQEHADLSKAYTFLRNVEHRIQILDDLQTQTMPEDGPGLRTLARRMGYRSPGREADELLRDYAAQTKKVRTIYDHLFASEEEETGQEPHRSDYAVLMDPQTTEAESNMAFEGFGFQDPGKAYRNLLLLREGQAFVHQTPRGRKIFSETFPVLFDEIVRSPDPDMALNHLESFLAAQGSWDAFQSFVHQDPIAVKSLIAIFANSQYFSRKLIGNPALFQDMIDTGRSGGAAGRFSSELASMLQKEKDVAERLDVLRRFKHREEIRIGMSDLLADIPSPAFSRSLSKLAEACVQAALGLAAEETSKYYGGGPSTAGLAIIAVGKLGGRELTYASDLDILFVVSEDRTGTPRPGIASSEYYSRIAEKTISYLSTITREGFVYRVDTRLRPGGSKGPLVQSIESFRKHFSEQAGIWERQAMLNARCIAGDRDAADEFCAVMQDLIYQDSDRKTLAAEVRSMRYRMEEELGKGTPAALNIKQGAGGLVDIEFLVQYLQLLYGRKNPLIRTPGTGNALSAIGKEGLLDAEDVSELRRAYQFLRVLESRMRVVSNQATNMLVRDADQLRPLARRMGYGNETIPEGRRLLDDYDVLRQRVRNAFDRIVQ